VIAGLVRTANGLDTHGQDEVVTGWKSKRIDMISGEFGSDHIFLLRLICPQEYR
jgi:hypothetical protein